MTIPKEIRRALDLKPSEKVMVTSVGDQAVLKPLKGNILILGGSIKIPGSVSPADSPGFESLVNPFGTFHFYPGFFSESCSLSSEIIFYG
jgi:AbrB family looped-hinge helix DNA binding protein